MSEFKKVTPTNFKVSIEKEFADIIYKINDESRSLITIRKKIEFFNGFHMNVTEHTEKGIYITKYYYDLFDPQGDMVFKFHSEDHKGDKRYQPDSEPYHIHTPIQFTTMDRLDNWYHRELPEIMEFLRLLFIYLKRHSL